MNRDRHDSSPNPDDALGPDLAWLRAERPSPVALATRATEDARLALLEHAAQPAAVLVPIDLRQPSSTVGADVDRRVTRRPVGRAATAAAVATLSDASSDDDGCKPARRISHPARIAAMTATAIAVAAAVLFALLVSPKAPGVTPTPPAAASPLVRLSTRVSQSPPPPGDATLIFRKQAYPDGRSDQGFDLYLDNGEYYWAPTTAQLAQAMKDSQGDPSFGREVQAAKAALTLPAAEARSRMANAGFAPGTSIIPGQPVYHPQPMNPKEQAIIALKRQMALQANHGTTIPPASPTTIEEGYIWDNSMDALAAGAGQPAVRAGVLKLLATVSRITVSPSTFDGKAVLVLTARLFDPGYSEQLTVDASTGMPVRFVGGYDGKVPSTVTTYQVSRVTAADLAPAH
jgi:hypothetical protein